MEKKKKEQKKKTKTTEIKEVKMSYKIESHDYGVRMRQMFKFIEEGDKVSWWETQCDCDASTFSMTQLATSPFPIPGMWPL